MEVKFRHIARALVVKENRILIARMIGRHSFLPGGGIDPGESAVQALIREFREELGVRCTVKRFLGVVETMRTEQDSQIVHHEISHLFEVESDELDYRITPRSLEPHLEFYWIELSAASLQANEVLPPVIQTTLPSLLSESGDRNVSRWISTENALPYPHDANLQH